MVPPVRSRSAAVSESNSALTGRVVDSYTNIQSVKLFAHAEREDAFVAEVIGRHTRTLRNLMRAIFLMTVTLTVLNTALILAVTGLAVLLWIDGGIRSEEHTSELQSLMRISYAVFCLKKKKNKYGTIGQTTTSSTQLIASR